MQRGEISELTTPKIPIPEPIVVMVGMMSNLPACIKPEKIGDMLQPAQGRKKNMPQL